MNHDIPDFKTNLRLALAETDTGPSPESLLKAPILDHWFGASKNGFPLVFGKIRHTDEPPRALQTWKQSSLMVGRDKNGSWVRTLNRFYRLSDEPCPSIPDFEKGCGRLVLQGVHVVSEEEFTDLVKGFSRRARWYLSQIN